MCVCVCVVLFAHINTNVNTFLVQKEKKKLTELTDLLPALSALFSSLAARGHFPAGALGAVRAREPCVLRCRLTAPLPAVVLTANCLMCGQFSRLWSCGMTERCPITVDRVTPWEARVLHIYSHVCVCV